jgi:T1SS-143 domain-containing protein
MAIENTTTAKAVTSGTQLSSVGTVKTIVGLVKAVDANGAERVLQVGDKVYANETIVTSADGGVIIEFPNGSHLDLPRSAHIKLDPEIYAATAGKSIEQEASDEAARIARAIAEGRDPNAVADPAAAGGETGDEGTTIPLVVDFDNTQGNVTSGYPTGPISLTFPPILQELPPVPETSAPEQINLPVAGVTSIAVDEDDIQPQTQQPAPAWLTEFALANGASNNFSNAPGVGATDGNDSNADEGPADDLDDPTATVISGNLNADFGADGAGDITFDSVQSLLFNGEQIESGGQPVQYWVSEDGHTIVGFVAGDGETGNKIIFSAEITDPATGAYTFTLYGSLDHPGLNTEDNILLNLNFTITDSNNDSASGVLSIDVDDDSPDADFALKQDAVVAVDDDNLGVAVTVLAEDLFTDSSSSGADTPATTTYTLVLGAAGINGLVDSGLQVSSDDTPIYLFAVSDTEVEGRVGGETGAVAFTISVNADGDVTVTQNLAVEHDDDADPIEEGLDAETLAAGALTLQQEVVDADGDSDTDTVDLGAIIQFADSGPAIDPVNAIIRKETDNSVTGSLNLLSGADAPVSVKLTIASLEDGDQIDGLTSGDEPVLYRVSGDGFEGYVSVDGVETVIFTVTPNTVDGTYTVNIVGTLDGTSGSTVFDLGNGITGGNTDDFYLLAPDVNFEDSTIITVNNTGTADDLFAAIDPGTNLANPDGIVIHASAYDSVTNASLTVNSSAYSLAVGTQQSIAGNDVLVLEFTQASSWQYDKTGGNKGLYDAAGATVYEPVDSLSFALYDFGPGEVIKFTMYLANGEVETGTITATADFVAISGATGITVELLQGMESGDIVDNLLFTFDDGTLDESFTKIEFSAEAGTDYKIGEIGIIQITEGTDQSFDVTATATDADGDVATNTFIVTLDGNGGLIGTTSDDVLAGGIGNDILNGGDGNDLLIGGDGNDTLTGGGGRDTFLWNSGDTGADQVTDFVIGAAGDILDISDLLTDGLSMTAASVAGHLQLQFTDATDTVVQTIDLNNIAAADATAATNLMNQLLLSGNIDDGV